mgnify:CR=1 FL=1
MCEEIDKWIECVKIKCSASPKSSASQKPQCVAAASASSELFLRTSKVSKLRLERQNSSMMMIIISFVCERVLVEPVVCFSLLK